MRRRLRLLYLDLADWLAEDATRVYDLTAAAGGLLVAWGLWLIFPPAAIILVGLGLVVVGALGAKVWAARKRQRPDD